MKNKRDINEKKRENFKVLIPPVAPPLIAIAGVLLAVITYIMVVPFNFSFVSGETEVYRQESVGLLSNVERNAANDEGSSGWEKVYGEKKLSFSAEDGENDIRFEENYGNVKKLMLGIAFKNLFTFAWSEEDFTIEFVAN